MRGQDQVQIQGEIRDTLSEIKRVEMEKILNSSQTQSDKVTGTYGDHRQNLYDFADKHLKAPNPDTAMKREDGTVIETPQEMEEELKRIFEKIFEARPFPNMNGNIPVELHNILEQFQDDLLQPITKEELAEAIKDLPSGHKSAGLSNIPNSFLKNMGPHATELLFQWITTMWEEEDVPEEAGLSLVTMLYKKGYRCFLSNYRTLAVGCNLCKVYLKIIEARLRKAKEKSGLLGEFQSGFRKGRRCQDNLMC